MKRFGSWLSKPAHEVPMLSAADEQEKLHDAMASAAILMNDDYDGAEAALSKGDTPFHKIGLGCVYFLRSILGMDKKVIEKAARILADAEESSLEHQKRAIRDPQSASQSAIYPVGSEYALAHAEAQLMGSVVAIMNASFTESLKGLYKLKKAYSTLNELAEAEERYLKEHPPSSASVKSSVPRASNDFNALAPGSVRSEKPSHGARKLEDDDDDDDDFVDANEDADAFAKLDLHDKGAEKLNGHANRSGSTAMGSNKANSIAPQPEEVLDFRSVTSDPVDQFIHSGVGLAFGTLQLVLSLIPPPFNKILSIFAFRGDRKTGLSLLWSSTRFVDNVNGALASLITLVFHNGPIAFCDILPADALPTERLESLLHELRVLYPKSLLWLLEEAVMLSEARHLQASIDLLASGGASPLKSINAIKGFQHGLHLLYAHQWEPCAEIFVELVDISDWSHGLYLYIAGVSYVELYRTAKASDPEKAKVYADKATELLNVVVENTGKKKVLGRTLPVEEYVKRKIAKFNARAAARKVELVDAIGVSPAEDIIYFWSGYMCMPEHDLNVSLERLAWSENSPAWADEPLDEKTLLSLLRGTIYRHMGQLDKAKAEFEDGVLSHQLAAVKASSAYPDVWQLALAHYELAVCLWKQAGGEGGDRALLQECGDQLYKVSHWGSYELESGHGVKVSTAVDTLKKCGIQI